jgi:hypothetical protein
MAGGFFMALVMLNQKFVREPGYFIVGYDIPRLIDSINDRSKLKQGDASYYYDKRNTS